MKICITCEGISEAEEPHCRHCGTPMLAPAELQFPVRRGEADAAHPLIGQLIGGKYRVLGVLGKGGMGTVYKAVHEGSLVPIALKILHPRFASRPEYRSWFLAEARKAGRVVHENCARVQDVSEEDNGTVYIGMEFVEGITLAEWLDSGRRIDPATTVSVLLQMVRALESAHEAGVVHRDLAPRNVMVTVRDQAPFVKILDFGIAIGATSIAAVRRVGSEGSGGLEPSGFATPPFAAPEALAGEGVSESADLYSLGVIAYRMLSGRLPVAGETGEDLIQATLEGDLRPLGSVPGVPRSLRELVESLLARDPSRRPRSAGRVATELRRIQESQGRMLRLLSVAALVLSTFALLAVSSLGTERPAFRNRPGARIALQPGLIDPDRQAATVLRSEDLRQWAFECVGRVPRQLRFELRRDGRTLGTAIELEPEIGGSDQLLGLPDDRRLDQLLEELSAASAGGPVQLVLGLPSTPLLYSALLVVDDRPPELELELSEAPEGLVGDTEIRWTMQEIHPAKIEALLQGADDSMPIIVSLPIETAGAMVASDLLGDVLPEVQARTGAHQLWLRGTDSAGNVRESETLELPQVDLFAPRVIPPADRLIRFDDRGAWLRLQLDPAEDGVEFLVRDPRGNTTVLRQDPERGEALLPHPVDGSDFAAGEYQFQARDQRGNLGPSIGAELTFATEVARVDFEVEGQSGVLQSGGALVLSGAAECLARFSPLFQLQGEVVDATGQALSGALRCRDAGQGTSRLQFAALPPGEFVLRLQLENQGRRTELSWDLVSLPEAPHLQLPTPRGGSARFLVDYAPELLQRRGERIGPGSGVRLLSGRLPFLRGRIWSGAPEASQALELSPGAESWEQWLPTLPLREGENQVWIQIEDLFGRPCRWEDGSAPSGVPRQLAGFFHSEEPFRAENLRVEWGRDARLVLRSDLPLDASAALAVRLQGATEVLTQAPRGDRAGAAEGGPRFDFVVPWADLPLSRVTRDAFGSHAQRLELSVDSPFGVGVPVVVQLVTVRSLLGEERISDLVEDLSAIPAELADLRMVPVIPRGYEAGFVDPVAADLPLRSSFRPRPAVATREIGDYFLQGSELTRGQYGAIVLEGLRRQRERAHPWAELVHGADPMGSGRLDPDRLFPPGFRAALNADARRPVTGVDFFQAWTASRLAGLLLQDDPDLFRLPTGIELELAAYPPSPESRRPLYGAYGFGGVRVDAYQRAMTRRGDPSRWPCTEEELAAVGDRVTVSASAELPVQPWIAGLDFGVREWVLDLPFGPGAPELMRSWLRNHAEHLDAVRALAQGEGDMPPAVVTFCSQVGVLRGQAIGDPDGLADMLGGRATPVAEVEEGDVLAAGVPGVVRILQLRRDGIDPWTGTREPELQQVGFRLAGGEPFVSWVRRR